MSNVTKNNINFDDIPELTKEDFARGKKNPFAGKFKNDYTIIVEHVEFDEVITVSKKRCPKKKNVKKQLAVAEETRLYEKEKPSE